MIRRFALALALLMQVAIDGVLLAEVVPDVLIAKESSKEKAIKEIERLTKEAEEAEDAALYDKAIALLDKILVLEKKHLGEGHQDVGGTLSWMGGIYKEMGQYNKAENTVLRALAIREKVLGAEHPGTATSLNNLALLYANQGV